MNRISGAKIFLKFRINYFWDPLLLKLIFSKVDHIFVFSIKFIGEFPLNFMKWIIPLVPISGSKISIWGARTSTSANPPPFSPSSSATGANALRVNRGFCCDKSGHFGICMRIQRWILWTYIFEWKPGIRRHEYPNEWNIGNWRPLDRQTVKKWTIYQEEYHWIYWICLEGMRLFLCLQRPRAIFQIVQQIAINGTAKKYVVFELGYSGKLSKLILWDKLVSNIC